MADELFTFPMMILKSNSSVDYNYWLKHLNGLLNEPTKQNLVKVSKVVMLTNKITLI